MGDMYDHSRVLVDLIQKRNIKTIAEIGVWKGKNARFILRSNVPSVEMYWGIDQFKPLGQEHGHMGLLSFDDWDGHYLRECLDMYYFNRFRIIRASSVDAVKIFPDEYFDLVFIDASHFGKDVESDCKAWLPKVKLNGLLAGHDYGNKHIEVKPTIDRLFGEENLTIYNIGFVWVYEKKTADRLC